MLQGTVKAPSLGSRGKLDNVSQDNRSCVSSRGGGWAGVRCVGRRLGGGGGVCVCVCARCLHRCSSRLWARRRLESRGVDSNQNGIERPIAGVTAFDRVVDEAPDCQAEKKSRLEDVRTKRWAGGRERARAVKAERDA